MDWWELLGGWGGGKFLPQLSPEKYGSGKVETARPQFICCFELQLCFSAKDICAKKLLALDVQTCFLNFYFIFKSTSSKDLPWDVTLLESFQVVHRIAVVASC